MQCLLGCTGVSPAQHNYRLFWGVVLGSAMFRLCSDVFCYVYTGLALLYSPLSAFFPPSSVHLWHISISLFVNVLLTRSLSDLLQLFEQTISISGAFAVSSLLLWDLKCLLCLLQWFFFFSICWHHCYTKSLLSSTLELEPLAWSLWLTCLLAWGWEILVIILFTQPVWQLSMGIPMFPKSCKYLLCDLMSADSISDHKDISWLPIPVSSSREKYFFLPVWKYLKCPKSLNEMSCKDAATLTF